jgi:Holliday junction resolvase RusA-like endonuclease
MRISGRHLVRLEVIGRPAVFATASEKGWKAAVTKAVSESGISPASGRFAVRMIFRTPAPQNANEKWDIDNLVKPTLDAMEGVFGRRQWQGREQPADDRVDRIEAEKRQVAAGESPGATIDVWVVGEDTNSAAEPVNIDADPINADWIKVVARMDKIRSQHPELSDIEVRLRAERDHLASIHASSP